MTIQIVLRFGCKFEKQNEKFIGGNAEGEEEEEEEDEEEEEEEEEEVAVVEDLQMQIGIYVAAAKY